MVGDEGLDDFVAEILSCGGAEGVGFTVTMRLVWL